MAAKTKLELTWIGKDTRHQLEPRILLEEREKSCHAAKRVTDNDLFDNRLIFGDNLLALKALEQEYAGKIKCIYIDPPFNTGEMFEHYDDGLEHSIWLTQMRDRIEILHQLLSREGSLFVHIDDNELGYLIAVIDEIFGRANRIAVITFKQSSISGPKAINPGLVSTASYILYYVKSKDHWKPTRVFQATDRDDRYNKYIVNNEEPCAQWQLIQLKDAFAAHHGISTKKLKAHFGEELETALTEFVLQDPTRVVRTARVAPKDVNPDARAALAQSEGTPERVFRSERTDRSDYYFLNGEQLIFYSAKARQIDGKWVTALPASTIWDDLLSNNLHKEGQVEFSNGKKPEALLKRVIALSTQPGDWVLDSFGGSGTTAAVSHKMGRKWITVELNAHCHTHIVPRLKRVINGNDDSGITEAVGWKGGGGFRYYRLAPSLLMQDGYGNWVISKEYNAAMLAEALCKHEGFTYSPSEAVYWQHGHSTERDFIFVTTQQFSKSQLVRISEEVGPQRTLLICCSAFRSEADAFPNLTLKKIPKAVLSRCEWGRDDYSLEIASLPAAESADDDSAGGAVRGSKAPTMKNGKKFKPAAGPSLFEQEGER